MRKHGKNEVASILVIITTDRELNTEEDAEREIDRGDDLANEITRLIRGQTEEGGIFRVDGLTIKVIAEDLA